mmetsp:Transcript_97676/g.209598  ORF Transcript_97676/g.209598 Transcript_97676/m.209598 type:complete len:359 (-) Transcript_97676:94-1170(-)
MRIYWTDLIKVLPWANDELTKTKRQELFNTFDPERNGVVSQSYVVRSMFRLMPPIPGISDIKLVLNQAFRSTRDVVPPIANLSIHRLDWNQFRMFLMYLWYYIKMWEHFAQIDKAGDKKVTVHELKLMMPKLCEWGFKDSEAWNVDVAGAFARLDKQGLGKVDFEEFADFCLRHALHDLGLREEEKERGHANRTIARTNPHLVDPSSPKKRDLWFNGSTPPVPPPGQRRPPPALAAEIGQGRGQGRWETQYMCDYLSPSSLNSKSPSVASTPAALSRREVSMPGLGSPYSAQRLGLLSPKAERTALVRSSSVPARGPPEQDRYQMKSRLVTRMDMYNTGQMRKLLEVAGSIVVGPPVR